MTKGQMALLISTLAFYGYRGVTAPFRLVRRGLKKVGGVFGRREDEGHKSDLRGKEESDL